MRRSNNNDDDDNVTVVVGGVTFQHSRALLCHCSAFFEAALFGHDMIEKTTQRVEFPTKDPEEWRLFSLFLEPGIGPPEINKDNIHVIVQWAEELCLKSDSLKLACDEIYPELYRKNIADLNNGFGGGNPTREELHETIGMLPFACQFGLPRTQRTILELLSKTLGKRGVLYVVLGMKPLLGDVVEDELLWHAFYEAACLPCSLQSKYSAEVPAFEMLLHDSKAMTAPETHVPLRHTRQASTSLVVTSSIGVGDVTVVVGGVEFKHSSVLLCYSSQYFEDMFGHDINEKTTKRVEFPTKDPDEWRLFSPFLEAGIQKPEINKDNIHVIVQWADELCLKSDSLRLACDDIFPRLYKEMIKNSVLSYIYETKYWEIIEFIRSLEIACQYRLPKTRVTALQYLSNALGKRGVLYLVLGMKPLLGDVAELWDAFYTASCVPCSLQCKFSAKVPAFEMLLLGTAEDTAKAEVPAVKESALDSAENKNEDSAENKKDDQCCSWLCLYLPRRPSILT